MFTDTPYDKIRLGCDGCGVPVFAVPGPALAKSYLRMACPELLPDASMAAVTARMVSLMNQYPQLVRGRDYICSVMNSFPNITAKGGASGVYTFGLKKERLGVMLKIYDGTETSWQPVIAEILRQVSPEINRDLIEKLENTELIGTTCRNIRNMTGAVIGEMTPVFRLEKHS
jgi:L-asparaginase II